MAYLYNIEMNEKKPKANVTLDYEKAAASYLDKLNTWARGNGYEPKYDSLEEFKKKLHLAN